MIFVSDICAPKDFNYRLSCELCVYGRPSTAHAQRHAFLIGALVWRPTLRSVTQCIVIHGGIIQLLA